MEDTTITPARVLGRFEEIDTQCSACGAPTKTFSGFVKYGAHCDACSAKYREEKRQEMLLAANLIDASGWERICPPDFQSTVAHRLPSPTKLQRVMEWRYGPKGLVLHGVTGLGKSRCLYELLKREFKSGRTVAVMDHSTAFKYSEAYERGPGAVNHWMEHRMKVDILALDDLFKAKLTDSFEQVVFTIVASRTERALPILMTTQDVGKTLMDRMSPDRGPALIRRLREFCDSVSFQ